MNAQDTIPSLIEALSELRTDMLRAEERLQQQIQQICEVHREGARTSLTTLPFAVMTRKLQEELASLGLSSMGRVESDVLGAVDAVLGVLRLLAGGADPLFQRCVSRMAGICSKAIPMHFLGPQHGMSEASR